jgi:hypothetical protein
MWGGLQPAVESADNAAAQRSYRGLKPAPH